MPPLIDSVTTKRGSSDVLSPESAVDPLQTHKLLLAFRTMNCNRIQTAAGAYTSGNPRNWQSVGLMSEPKVPLRSLAFPCVPFSRERWQAVKKAICARSCRWRRFAFDSFAYHGFGAVPCRTE